MYFPNSSTCSKLYRSLSTSLSSHISVRLSLTSLGIRSHLVSVRNRPKSVGGMVLPHFQLYDWESNLRASTDWLQTRANNEPPAWVQMEADASLPLSLSAWLCSTMSFTPRRASPAPPHIRLCVYGLRCGDTLAGRPADFVPLSWQTIISPSLKHDSVLVWREKGNVSFEDLYIADTFASFDQLRAQFDLPKSRFKISTGPGLDLWPNMIISSNP